MGGQVVLVSFGTYTCINWIRSLPHVRAWADEYRGNGLAVFGVQTPEFEFEGDLDNVSRAIKEMDVVLRRVRCARRPGGTAGRRAGSRRRGSRPRRRGRRSRCAG